MTSMVIPLSNEEYFENDLCMNCHQVMDFPIHFYFPHDQVLELCESCSFGLYQCVRCAVMVSHLANTQYQEMVYMGPDNAFDEFMVFCPSCAANVQRVGVAGMRRPLDGDETDTETDTEQEAEVCEEDSLTQNVC